MNIQEEPIDPELLGMIAKLEPVPERDPDHAMEGRALFLTEARSLKVIDEASSRRGILSWLGLAPNFSTNHGASRPSSRPRFSAVSLALTLFIVVILFMGGTGATVYAAQEALPGDTLYPLKNVSEDARLTLTRDPGDDAFLYLDFARRRLDEISRLIDRNRYGNINIASGQFENHILRAIAAISEVAQVDPARSELLALYISQTLSEYTGELSKMAGAVPLDDSRDSLEQALRTSRLNISTSEVEFTALVSSQDMDRWIIGGLEIFTDSSSEIQDGIQPGDLVQVHATVSADGRLVASEIKPAEKGEESEIELTGLVELVLPDFWMIGGQEFLLTPDTEIDPAIRVGDPVEVKADQAQDGSLIARQINAVANLGDQEEEFSGLIETMDGEYWTIGGTLVLVPAGAEIEGPLQPGDLVTVKVAIDTQGNLIAVKIELEKSGQNLSTDEGVNPTAEATESVSDDHNEQEIEDNGDAGEDNSGPGNSEDNGEEDKEDKSGPGNGGHSGEDDNSGSGGGEDN